MFRYPDKPILAAPAIFDTLQPGRWLAQAKMDGWRCLIHKTQDGLTFTSRHREPIPVAPTTRDQAAAALESFPVGTLIDSEWMGRRAGADEHLVLFDLLHDGAAWMGALPCFDRFGRLIRSTRSQARVQLVTWATDDYADLFSESKTEPLWEGVVVKAKDSRYIGSVRGCVENPQWFKVRYRAGADGRAIA